jgi:hypothetical protein
MPEYAYRGMDEIVDILIWTTQGRQKDAYPGTHPEGWTYQ